MALTQKAPFRFQQTADRQTNDLQRFADARVRSVVEQPWANGIKIGPVVFPGPSSSMIVNHGLGRVPNGFFPIDVQTNVGSFMRIPQTQSLDKASIQIVSLYQCTAIFWVF